MSEYERVEQLQRADGTPIKVYLCLECLTWAHGSAEMASECCKPRACECGQPLDRACSKCDTCWAKQRAAKETAIFEAAEKIFVDDWKGAMVAVDDEVISTDALEEYLDERLAAWQDANPNEPVSSYSPPRVYATRIEQHCIDGTAAIENALSDAHEDAHDAVGREAEQALNAYLRKWSEEHLPCTYREDSTRALVPSSDGLWYSIKTCAELLGVPLQRCIEVVKFLGWPESSKHMRGVVDGQSLETTRLSHAAFVHVRREFKSRSGASSTVSLDREPQRPSPNPTKPTKFRMW